MPATPCWTSRASWRIGHLADDQHAVTVTRTQATADGEIVAAAQVTQSVVRVG